MTRPTFHSLRQIIFPGVFLDHAIGGELRHECDHCAADALNPLARNALFVAVEEHRNDLLGERPVKIGAVHAVLLLDIIRVGIAADGKTVGAVVAFAPPAVENAKIQAAIAAGLHAAGAGRFQRTARVVQPHVAAGNHLPCDVNVVVFDKHHAACQSAVFAQVNDLLDEALALVVARMRLAGENKLHGPLLVMREFHDVVELLENQRRALVSRKAAREADGQRVGIQQAVEADEIALGHALVLEQQPAADELDHLAPQFVAQRPKLLVGNKRRVGHFFPEFRVVNRRRPILSVLFIPHLDHALFFVLHFFPPELAHGTFHPAEQVDAVGDVADGDFFNGRAGIKGLPHVAADVAVEFAHAVGGARHLEREDGHAKRLLRVFRMHAAQRQDVLKRHGQLVLVQHEGEIHQFRREAVVAGFHRRVGGENTLRLGRGERVGKFCPATSFSRINSSVRKAACPSFM